MRETAPLNQTAENRHAGRTLLAYLRHEFRTPLSAIIGYSEMLLEETPHGEFGEGLQKMLAAGRKLLALVDSLLAPSTFAATTADNLAESLGSDIRYQLRTLLTTVSGYCELLLEEAEELGYADCSNDLERIRRAADRFLSLIDNVVEMARLETDATSDTQTAAVARLIKETVSEPRPLQHNESFIGLQAAGSLLVVDDNEINRDLLARRLSREGHQVAVATNGREALEMIAAGSFDLVLLDVIMPEMSGYQVLEALKAQGSLRDLPVIMISALGEMDSVVRCIGLGAEDYLPKPYEPLLLRARIGASLEKKRLRDRLRDQLRLVEQELDVAARLQQSILPRKFPRNDRFEIFAEMIPARAVGGDFYDFFSLDDARLGFTIADVSGKGIPAALFMALSRALLKATAGAGLSAGECLERVNRLVQAENHTGMFVTVFYGILNIFTGEVEFANAGHNHPYLLRPGASPELLSHRNSLVIGVMKQVQYPTHHIQLQPGDSLFLYTDGVTEAMNEEGELFSEERLEQFFSELAPCPCAQLTRSVINAVRTHAGHTPQSDDITMLVVRYCQSED